MVESLYLVPVWFFNIDIFLGLAFAIVCIIVAKYAYRIYNITHEIEFKLFGLSFTFISISYLLRTIMNDFLSHALNSHQSVLEISDINIISSVLIYSFVFLYIAGYVTLAYTVLKEKSKRAYYIMLALAFLTFILSENNSLALYLIIIVILLPIVYHYGNLYFKTKNNKRLNMLIATILLLISNLISLFITDYLFYQGYIISSIVELVAYTVIAISLYNINSYGEKKK